jgi:hypothetical protein
MRPDAPRPPLALAWGVCPLWIRSTELDAVLSDARRGVSGAVNFAFHELFFGGGHMVQQKKPCCVVMKRELGNGWIGEFQSKKYVNAALSTESHV